MVGIKKHQIYQIYQFHLIINKFIIKKLDKESDIFDALFCTQKNIEKVTIPSSIKIISPFAFCDCKSLISVDFESNSKLEVVSKNSGIETTEIIPSNFEMNF